MSTDLHDAAMFKALSDTTRIKILATIREAGRALTVREIANRSDVEYTTTSGALQKLKSVEAVIMQKRGKERVYELSPTLSQRLFESATFFAA